MDIDYWKNELEINEDMIRRIQSGENFGKVFDKEETLKILRSRRDNCLKRIKKEKYKTCNHFLIKNLSGSTCDWTEAACIKCGLDPEVICRGQMYGEKELSEDEKIMYEAFVEKYKHYNYAYFLPGELHLEIEMDLENACKIYNNLLERFPSLNESELCSLFVKKVLHNESCLDDDIQISDITRKR